MQPGDHARQCAAGVRKLKRACNQCYILFCLQLEPSRQAHIVVHRVVRSTAVGGLEDLILLLRVGLVSGMVLKACEVHLTVRSQLLQRLLHILWRSTRPKCALLICISLLNLPYLLLNLLHVMFQFLNQSVVELNSFLEPFYVPLLQLRFQKVVTRPHPLHNRVYNLGVRDLGCLLSVGLQQMQLRLQLPQLLRHSLDDLLQVRSLV
mmetsp:Transcript_17147/g.30644  ORF Transcript_17147/g.30644 Transcript_17147/m.30644 type:complete len:207 (-) Transcript_17147:86-706(-)